MLQHLAPGVGASVQVRLRRIGENPGSEQCLMEEVEQDTHLHIGRTKDWKYLLLNANSKSTSEVQRLRLLLIQLESAVIKMINTARLLQYSTAITLAKDSAMCLKVHMLDAHNPWTAQPVLVMPRQQGVEYFVEHHNTSLYIMTNRHPQGEMRIMTACTSQLPQRCSTRPHYWVALPWAMQETQETS